MKLFDKFFGRGNKSQSGKDAMSRTRFVPRMEPLEERQMLSVNPLVSGNGTVGQDGTTDMNITFDMADNKTGIVGIQITATDGSAIDPAKVQIFAVTSGVVGTTPLTHLDGSTDNISTNNNGSVVYVSVADGEYAIRVSGENDTYGSFKCDVFVPGSIAVEDNGEEGSSTMVLNGSGTIAQYINFRQNRTYNENALQFYNNVLGQYGTSFFNTKYDAYFDLNGDGTVSQSEVGLIISNSTSQPGTITAIFEADSGGPSATMNLNAPNDDAKEAGVTNTPVGSTVTITDSAGVQSAQIGFKDANGVIQFINVTINPDDPTTTTITLTEDLLKTMKGGPLDEVDGTLLPGTYELYLTATDTKGNKSEAVEILTFSVVGDRDLVVGSNPERTMNEHQSGGFSANVPITIDDDDKVGGNGDTLVYELLSSMDAAVGTVTFNQTAGTFTYTPGTDINPGLTVGQNYGTESDPLYDYYLTFIIKASDLVGNSEEVTITIKITPENDAPVASDDLGANDEGIEHALADGTTLEVDILDNDTDGDKYDTISIGDKIVYDGVEYTFDNNAVSIPVENPVTGTDGYITITRTFEEKTSGNLTKIGTLVVDFGTAYDYLPASERELLEFTYTVTDTQGASDTADVLIEVIGKNEAPTANDIDLNSEASDPDLGFDLGVTADKEKLEAGIEVPWKTNVSDPDEDDAITLVGIDGQAFTEANDWTIVIQKESGNITCTFTLDEEGKLWLKTEFASDAFDFVALAFEYNIVDSNSVATDGNITLDIYGTQRHIVIEDDQELQVALPSDPGADTWYEAKTAIEFTPARDSTYTFTVTEVNGSSSASEISSFQIDADGNLTVKGSLPAGTYALTVEVLNDDPSYPEDNATVTVSVLVSIFDENNYPDPDVKNLGSINEDGSVEDADVTDAWNAITGTGNETWAILSGSLVFGGITGGTTPSGYDAANLVYSLDPLTGLFTFEPGSEFIALGLGQSSELSFTYTIKSSLHDVEKTATITLTVNGVNNAPVVSGDFTHAGTVLEGDTTGIHFDIDDFASLISDTDDTDTTFTFASLGGVSPNSVNGTESDRTVTFSDGSYAIFDLGGTGFTFFPSFNSSTNYYALRDGATLAFSLAFTVTDGKASSAAGTNINMSITGTNKTPVFKQDAPTGSTIKQSKSTVLNASDFATDANTADNLYFTAVTFDSNGTETTMNSRAGDSYQEYVYGNNEGTIRLYDLDYTVDPSKAGQIEFFATGVYSEDEMVPCEFSFKVADDSGADNNETAASFTYTITIDTGSIPRTDFTAVCTEDGTVTQGPSASDWESTWSVDPSSIQAGTSMDVSAHGDNSGGTESLPSGFANVEFSIDADGNFTFDPNGVFDFLAEGQTAKITFTFDIADSETLREGTGTITLTITGRNSAPVASDYAPTDEIPIDDTTGITITIQDLIDAGRIVDGDRDDVFNFTAINGVLINTNLAEDQRFNIIVDGKLQGYIIVEPGVTDSFTFYPASEAGTYFYDLQDGAKGTCVFTYTVSDGTSSSDGSAEITITVLGVNKTPVYVADPVLTSTIKSSNTLSLDPSDYATDANTGDNLYFTEVTFPDASAGYQTLNFRSGTSYQELTYGDNLGTIRLYDTDHAEKPGWIEFIANGTYTPGALIDLPFTFKITDDAGKGNSITGTSLTFDLKVNPGVAPSYPMNVAIDEDGTANQSPTAGTWDANWTASGLITPAQMDVEGYGSYAGGLQNLPSGYTATIAADGTFTFDPGDAFDFLSAGQTATIVFTYNILDSDFGLNGTGTVTLVITGKNAAPVTTNYTPGGSVVAGSSAGFVVNLADMGSSISDVDRYDTLSFASINGTTIVESSSEQRFNIYSGSVLVGEIVFAPNVTNSFTFYPSNAVGSDFYSLQDGVSALSSISYTVTDGTESSNASNIAITVLGVNKTPVARSTALVTGQYEGTTATITPNDWFTDANTGDVLKFESITVNETTLVQDTPVTIGETTFTWDSTTGNLFIDSTDAISLAVNATTVFNITATVMDYIDNETNTGLSGAAASGSFVFTLTGVHDDAVADDYDIAGSIAYASEAAGSAWAVTFEQFFTAISLTGPDGSARAGTETIWVLGVDGSYHDLKATTGGVELANGDFVFGVENGGVWSIEYRAIGDASMALRDEVQSNVTFEFQIYTAAGAIAVDDLTANITVEGVNKAPTLKETTVSKTVSTGGNFTYAASDLANDANTGDKLSFASIWYTAPSTGTKVEMSAPAIDGHAQVNIPNFGTLTWYGSEYTAEAGKAGLIEFVAAEIISSELEFTINYTVTDDGALTTAEGTIDVDIITGPSFNESKSLITGDYGDDNVVWDIAGAFSGLGNNAVYEIVSIDGKNVDQIGNVTPLYESFLTQASLDKLALGIVDDSVLLELNAYSWNLQTSTITIVVKATGDNTDSDGIEGEFKIQPTVQHSVEYKLVVQQTAQTNNDDYYDEITSPNPSEETVSGTRYFLQLWVTDTSNSLVAGSNAAYGIEGAAFKLAYDSSLSSFATNFMNNVYPTGLTNVTVVAESGYVEVAWVWVPESTENSNPPSWDGSAVGIDRSYLMLQVAVTASSNGDQTFAIEEFIANSGIDSLLGYERWTSTDINDCRTVHPSQIKIVNASTTQGPSPNTSEAETPVEETILDPSPLTAILGPEVAQDGGVYMRTVTETTATGANGTVTSLPDNADWIHEWQSHYVELWVKASEVDKYTSALTDLQYNTNYFTAVSVEYGPGFSGTAAVIDDANGIVSGIGGEFTGDASGEEYILLGRVRFESQGTDNVPWTIDATPSSLGLNILNPEVVTESGETISISGRSSNTELWCNPYDANDDGIINLSDISLFIRSFGQKSTEDNPLFNVFDFDRSGTINLSDCSIMIRQFGVKRSDVVIGAKTLSFPVAFTQRYVGSTIQTDNVAMVGAMLDAANQAWADALGVDPVTVQLAVRDYGDDSTLGEARIVELDEFGRPSKVIITIDDDGAGLGWYSQIGEPVAEGRYDLYTTLLHELGHAYGINTAYNAYNAVAYQYGNSVDNTGHATDPDDVMYYGLSTGERKYLSELDINIVLTAYGAAAENNYLRAVDSTLASKLETLTISETTVYGPSLFARTGIIGEISAEKTETAAVVVDSEAVVPTKSAMPGVFGKSALVPLGTAAVEAQSLAELQKVGLAVSVSQFKDMNREIKRDAFFTEVPKEGFIDFGFLDSSEKREQSDKILGEILNEFEIA